MELSCGFSHCSYFMRPIEPYFLFLNLLKTKDDSVLIWNIFV